MTEQTSDHLRGDLIARWQARRSGFASAEDDLPALDADLSALRAATVPDSAQATKGKKGSWALKRSQIAAGFVGKSELAFLNAQLIANLRRESFPKHAPALFRRLWLEEADHLLAELDLRWCVSSAQTFADHGAAGPERELGQALKMLFGLMKLYEFERLFTGAAPDEPHRFGRRSSAPMPLEMDQYSLRNGGLDAALLAPLYGLAEKADALRPLALHLLSALSGETGTIFSRLDEMKKRRAKARSQKENRN